MHGFAFAARLMSQRAQDRSPQLSEAARQALDDVLGGEEASAATMASALQRAPSDNQLADASPRVRSFLAPLLDPQRARQAAPLLKNLPMPRRGYRAPAGLAEAITRHRGREDTRRAAEAEIAEWEMEERSWRVS